jgi:pSer/pThr/pTyr-binding forkhead associated (FHA) protein
MPTPPPPAPKIVLVSGADDEGQGPWILSASEVIVGRKDDARWKCDPSRDIILKDQAVSRPHAKITKEGDKYFVQHMSTVNPTLVSEDGSSWAEVTGKMEFKPGSRMRVGRTELKFEP